MYRGTLRSMGNLALVIVLAMLFSGIAWGALGNNRGIAPIVPTPTEVTTLPLLSNIAVVFPDKIGAVGKYAFHAPTDFGVGVNVDSITTLEAMWGVPKAKDFYFVEPANNVPLFKISDNGHSVELPSWDGVFTNLGLLSYWCNNASVQRAENECDIETKGAVRNWWIDNFPEMVPTNWLAEPPLTLVPIENRAKGTVTAPTPAGP